MSTALLKRLFLLASFCFAATCVALANSVVVPFPAAGDAFTSASNGDGTIPSGGQTYFQWTTGDSVTSSIFTIPTSSSSVTGLTENWIYDDSLAAGDSETWNIYVNGVQVGTGVLNGCGYCGSSSTLTDTLSFSGIAPVAGGYQLALILQNTIRPGGGSTAWFDGGTTTLTYGSSVPEPSGLTALGVALLSGLAWVRRRACR